MGQSYELSVNPQKYLQQGAKQLKVVRTFYEGIAKQYGTGN